MVRLITEKYKELSDMTETQNRELRERVVALEKRVTQDAEKMKELEQHESDCHRQLIEMREKHRNFREWVIFTFGKKAKEPPPENSGGTESPVPPVKRNGRRK